MVSFIYKTSSLMFFFFFFGKSQLIDLAKQNRDKIHFSVLINFKVEVPSSSIL